MKSYAFVILLLPWPSFSRARSAEVTRFIVEEFMGKRCIKSEFFDLLHQSSQRSGVKPLEMQLIRHRMGDK